MGRMFCARARSIGLCQGCRTTVYNDDDWTAIGIGVAHRECVEYVRRRRPRLRRRRRPWWKRLIGVA